MKEGIPVVKAGGLLLAGLVAMLPPVVYGEVLRQEGFTLSDCRIESMDLSFTIERADGTPRLTSTMKWQAVPEAGNCLPEHTRIWLRARTISGGLKYIQLAPEVTPTGSGFGPAAVQSPDWNRLFCEAPTLASRCDAEFTATRLLGTWLAFEGFEVVTEDPSLIKAPPAQNNPLADPASVTLDIQLANAINEALPPGNDTGAPVVESSLESQAPEEQVPAPDEAELAMQARTSILELMTSSLSQYRTPARDCESSRILTNQIGKGQDTCHMTFASRADHEYLCEEDGGVRPASISYSARIDFSRDITDILPIRVSDDWASLTIHLDGYLSRGGNGTYQSNLWQFTVDVRHLEELKRLAINMLTLKGYCEALAK